MKKKNIILLIVACILSLFIFAGLMVYALHLQIDKDAKSSNTKHNTEDSSGNSGVTVSPTAAVTNAPVKEAGSTGSVLSVTPVPTAGVTESASFQPVVLDFAGDVNLDENYFPANKYDSSGKGISGIISGDLVKEMKAADIMMLNNEFCYSKRGTKTPDKSFTFRADPGRVDILKKMGVDIVSLANNHTLDYGPDALTDTFKTLDDAGIDYAGAGDNMDRAKAPICRTAGGRKIAFLAASRVIFAGSWYATDSRAGMVGTYDPSLILQSIKKAKVADDYVVVYVHWGIERQSSIVDYQRSLAQQYIDAGADAVIGSHPHTMQGFEYYKGKPIAYSLGNFIFSNKTERTGLLKLHLAADGSVKMQILPCMYSDTFTYLLTKESDKKDYFQYMKSISYGVNIDNDGYITAAE